MFVEHMFEDIARLKESRNAVILAHSYQRPEIQRIADFVGDSLELSIAAVDTDADLVVFCGVDFMAETAAVLNREKTVLIPVRAKCPMANSLSAEDVIRAKETGLPFVAYVNTLAEVKAEADICCTSANVVKVVASLDSDEVFLGPDRNLAWHAEWRTGKRVYPVPENGHCYVHVQFTRDDVRRARSMGFKVIVHPECPPDVQVLADYVGSTSQMARFVRENRGRFAVGTEIGLIERLRAEGHEVTPLKCVICREMKEIRIEDVLTALREEKYVVEVPNDVARRARRAIRRMLEVTSGAEGGANRMRGNR